MIDIENAKKVFQKYVANFNPEDGRIRLKIEHILRVAEYSKKLAENLQLDEEKIKLAVMASYDKDAKLNEEALKENLNKIDGINSKINEIKWNLEVSVDGFGFEITENGNIVYSGKGEDEEKEEVNPNIVVGYTFKNNSKSINKEKIYELKDNTKNNNNSKLYNI